MAGSRLSFRSPSRPAGHEAARPPWKLLIVDDEADVHEITKLSLGQFRFDGRRIEFLHALTAGDGFDRFVAHPDIAVALVDVVMEHEHAGLDLVRRIRGELANDLVRIVLRTGQPGSAPEPEVIATYDINDYKEKTELSARKLTTLMVSCLRTFRDLKRLDASRRGLERVIEAAAEISRLRTVDDVAAALLAQLQRLLEVDDGGFHARTDSLAAGRRADRIEIIAGSGRFAAMAGSRIEDALPAEAVERIRRGLAAGAVEPAASDYVGVFKSDTGFDKVLYLGGFRPGGVVDRALLDRFASQAGIGFEAIDRADAADDIQRELLYRLGSAVETRSGDGGNHLRRVAEIVQVLALGLGLGADEAEALKRAAPMHDLGKIGIPEAILTKPGRLTDAEWAVMQTHAERGHELLQGSGRAVLELGATIASDHHERWDGSGYPAGKAGESISLAGRITAVADVFDTLHSRRCYKDPWALDDVLAYIRRESGSQFDPRVVQALLDQLDRIVAIARALPD